MDRLQQLDEVMNGTCIAVSVDKVIFLRIFTFPSTAFIMEYSIPQVSSARIGILLRHIQQPKEEVYLPDSSNYLVMFGSP